MVKKAMVTVKARKKEEVAAFREMAKEMRAELKEEAKKDKN